MVSRIIESPATTTSSIGSSTRQYCSRALGAIRTVSRSHTAERPGKEGCSRGSNSERKCSAQLFTDFIHAADRFETTLHERRRTYEPPWLLPRSGCHHDRGLRRSAWALVE